MIVVLPAPDAPVRTKRGMGGSGARREDAEGNGKAASGGVDNPDKILTGGRQSVGMHSSVDDDFVAFAQAAAPRLRRTAYLMCRDWHLAQDLTQLTLTKMFVQWKRIWSTANPHAYSRRVLLHNLVDHRRRRSSGEALLAELPESAGTTDHPELRLTLLDALATLPERDRAIVVLRYWEDYSTETVAQVLGVSESVVKSQSHRALARLRALLGQEVRVA
jgi:RNA polymerase sigma-70 factor (sigma-E family)